MFCTYPSTQNFQDIFKDANKIFQEITNFQNVSEDLEVSQKTFFNNT